MKDKILLSVCKRSNIASSCLFHLNGFEKTLEVSNTKSLVVMSLNDFKKQRRSVLNRFGKDLK